MATDAVMAWEPDQMVLGDFAITMEPTRAQMALVVLDIATEATPAPMVLADYGTAMDLGRVQMVLVVGEIATVHIAVQMAWEDLDVISLALMICDRSGRLSLCWAESNFGNSQDPGQISRLNFSYVATEA
ncbi:hypothetical protein [Thiorhodovibrio winogradskyi]|uniref:hypothetical protein n=1 Tax=Thiorhodovibrio winogradskyi TaxID=77007 RepID=UPI002E2A565B|nr:hypothetical protein [Thiorhodovibrio winogradskyi]